MTGAEQGCDNLKHNPTTSNSSILGQNGGMEGKPSILLGPENINTYPENEETFRALSVL